MASYFLFKSVESKQKRLLTCLISLQHDFVRNAQPCSTLQRMIHEAKEIQAQQAQADDDDEDDEVYYHLY